MPLSGEAIRLMNYIDDVAVTLRRVLAAIPTLSAEERQKLRAYLLDGGMIIFNAGMGSKPFYESARKELGLIFPEMPVQRLASDHPIFHSYYDLNQVTYRQGVRKAGYIGGEPWFDGVTIDCRTVAVIS